MREREGGGGLRKKECESLVKMNVSDVTHLLVEYFFPK